MSGWCARPGCHRSATARFGFDSAARIVWIDAVSDAGNAAGDLCTRHADRLAPPRGWELRDLRPAPAPAPAQPERRRPRVRQGRESRGAQQPSLDLGTTTAPERAATAADAEPAAVEPASAWAPRFDPADDADGLLLARTPLLARAFRTG